MAIPHDDVIQLELLRVLSSAREGQMRCQDAYASLELRFPKLTHDEVAYSYRASTSEFSNRVQWARLHLVEQGWVHPPHLGGGRGNWAISDTGRARLQFMDSLADDIVSELSA
jgi:restriction endonuclease Mrr